jgi:quaternary ammonium compound-resistance protein SugE
MQRMAWIYLFIAGVLEIVWAILLKYTQGFTRMGPSLVTVVAMVFSFYFLALSLRTVPVGTAYAVWTGIGAVGTAILGMILFGESRHALRLACIALIVIGVLGLRLLTPAE